MKVYKIVFTGGPSGGKTDIINMTHDFFKSLNYKVILNSETARDIIASGIKPNPNDRLYTLWFQDLIIKSQVLKEKSSLDFSNNQKEDVVIILYDRSIPDNFAYLDNYEDYKNLLNKNGINELQSIDKFDLVINLSSLANFKEYEYKNDSERTENRDVSQILDYKTSTSYLLSRNMKVIYPTKNINKKYEIVKSYIVDLLNQHSKKETITYDVDLSNTDLSIYNKENSKILFIKEYYLANELNDVEYIVRKRYSGSETSYILDKVYKKDNTIIESKVIDKKMFNYLLKKYKVISETNKKIINFIYDFKKYSLILDNKYNCTLEIENSNFLTGIKIPENIKLQNNLVKYKKCDSIY